MKKRTALLALFGAALTLTATACGNSSTGSTATTTAAAASATEAAAADSKATKIKYSTVFAATGVQADGATRLGEIIAEQSEGRLAMELYAGSTLGDKVASMEGLQVGTIEMTECAATDLSTYSSIWSVFSLPYLWESGTQAVNTIQDPEVKAVLDADMENNGFIIIAWTDMGSRSILNKNKAVNAPTDLSGMKVRCMEDTVLAGAINAMGAIATPLAWSDCYTALQQGTIDGVENSPAVILSSGMTEVAKYFSLTEQFTIPDPVFVSKTWFDSLSEEDQAALLAAGEQFTAEWNESIWPEASESAIADLQEDGVEVNEVDKAAFTEAVQPVIDDFLAQADADQVALYELLTTVREKY
ncbi:MAG: TRAP transporter substrate-binding protein [Clostridiales bacterium]|nr:TRAP transporter substrate-binding protein [Clostridiales bacterium]